MEIFTPEFFNIIIVANMGLGTGLIIWRFRREMSRPVPDEQSYQDYLRALEEDTDPGNYGT